MVDCNPPLSDGAASLPIGDEVGGDVAPPDTCDLPVIDLGWIWSGADDGNRRASSAAAMAKAAAEWGFFQVVNHGVKKELIRRMRREQEMLFRSPFEVKSGRGDDGPFQNSYKWGNPTATRLSQFSWSEAFHIPVTDISGDTSSKDRFLSLRETAAEYVVAAASLGRLIAGLLAEELGLRKEELEEVCQERSCFLRLNRYPPCSISSTSSSPSELSGLVPHTDSDFLTILFQDDVGGLQLKKDSRWFAVAPINDALIVNIGDLLQAWSNDEYRSVEHKVVVNATRERYSIAFFMCPSYEKVIESYKEPSKYRRFTFREYRNQVQEDVKCSGYKVGLSRFYM